MTRTRKLITLPDWTDQNSVARFFDKIIEDGSKQMFSDYELERDRYETGIIKLSQAFAQAATLDGIPEETTKELLRVIASLLGTC